MSNTTTEGTTTMTNTRTTRTSKVIENGYSVSVDTGAVRGHSGGSADLYVCNTCGTEVVWATSARTGRRYLCNVRRSHNDGRFFMGNDIHRCDEIVAERDAQIAYLREQDITEARERVEGLRGSIATHDETIAMIEEAFADGTIDADRRDRMIVSSTEAIARFAAELPAAEQRLAELLTRYGMA